MTISEEGFSDLKRPAPWTHILTRPLSPRRKRTGNEFAVLAVVNVVTGVLHANTLESPARAKAKTGKSKTRRLQEAHDGQRHRRGTIPVIGTGPTDRVESRPTHPTTFTARQMRIRFVSTGLDTSRSVALPSVTTPSDQNVLPVPTSTDSAVGMGRVAARTTVTVVRTAAKKTAWNSTATIHHRVVIRRGGPAHAKGGQAACHPSRGREDPVQITSGTEKHPPPANDSLTWSVPADRPLYGDDGQINLGKFALTRLRRVPTPARVRDGPEDPQVSWVRF